MVPRGLPQNSPIATTFLLTEKTVAQRMRMMGIEGMSPRAFVPVTTIQAKRKSTLPDLVKRMCDTGELNRVWMSDIYLSAHR
ncbi:hypothetical protein GWO62_04690 [Corynebacterium macginleyi]|uniref:Uncharacterized protein n=1 Tax=Corynebacterium macginleyi TaxID=38290 RepID=A0ABS1Y474_9CORY|nr:hypothetical protein [Corynebacterium macginleyi]MBK4152476.1 hypothetical protein [Corynebacterium macginleyi]MBM0243091.1 hypothetical protein [Corynebacterium macginleyi]QRJ60329.1 hypothetical protein GWO70_001825 [Corynebacterium macginleyi]QRP21659.1 hypothetical protein I6J25_02130 [Corynebacterium macginleyi]